MAAFLQQGQRHLHPLKAHKGGHAHAQTLPETLLQIAFVGAYPPGQFADGQFGTVFRLDDVDGVIHRTSPLSLPALQGLGRQTQPLAQQHQHQPLHLKLLRQRNGHQHAGRGQQRVQLLHRLQHGVGQTADADGPRAPGAWLQTLLQQPAGIVGQHIIGQPALQHRRLHRHMAVRPRPGMDRAVLPFHHAGLEPQLLNPRVMMLMPAQVRPAHAAAHLQREGHMGSVVMFLIARPVGQGQRTRGVGGQNAALEYLNPDVPLQPGRLRAHAGTPRMTIHRHHRLHPLAEPPQQMLQIMRQQWATGKRLVLGNEAFRAGRGAHAIVPHAGFL